MTVEIRVPNLAESISEAVIVEWLKPDGAEVHTDEPIATLETDKAAVEIAAEGDGVLHHVKKVQDKVQVGDVIARIDENGVAARPPVDAKAKAPAPAPPPPARPSVRPPASPAPPSPRSGPPAASAARPAEAAAPGPPAPAAAAPLGPAVRKLIEENALDPASIPATGPGGRLLKEDVLRHLESARAAGPAPPAEAPDAGPAAPAPAAPAPAAAPARAAAGPHAAAFLEPEVERVVPMSAIRQRIAERLVRSQHTAAILTTFNEIDMTAVMALRQRWREDFEKRHGVKLGFMSLFARASVLALDEIPELNAEIRGSDIVYRSHVHMGIAVQTDRGLVVPVVKRCETLDFAGIEREIGRLAERARAHRLSLEELSGGTFTISNGGIYGSLLSTPILNPPQSGILGMHKIEKRPVAVNDQVVIRPMMYVALSYDHRIVDGEQAVTFLVRVKQRLEDPERMMLGV